MVTKRFILLLFISMAVFPLFAQKPQKIRGIAKEDKSIAYYQTQSSLWKQLTVEDPSNAEAWLQYYLAERARKQLQSQDQWLNQKATFYQELASIISQAQKYIPNTFEIYYLNGLNSEGDETLEAFQKAYAVDPNRTEVYGWLLVRYAFEFQEQKLAELAAKMLEHNSYSNANLYWNYNALQSVEKNAVILSNGDMDGIPKWVLQYGKNIRPDVLVVNKWMLSGDTEYRSRIWQLLKMDPPSKQRSDFHNHTAYTDYLAAALLKGSQRPAYISSGTPKAFFRQHNLEEEMYLVGNVLKYSNTDFDNTAALIRNVETNYFLDYLIRDFQNHPEQEVVKKQMNLTYLPGLVHLKKHYQKTRNSEKVKYFDKLIYKIAADSGRKEEVLGWFNQ